MGPIGVTRASTAPSILFAVNAANVSDINPLAHNPHRQTAAISKSESSRRVYRGHWPLRESQRASASAYRRPNPCSLSTWLRAVRTGLETLRAECSSQP
jgi:hypothetical protein